MTATKDATEKQADITPEQRVWQAADALREAGTNPTVRAVRMRTGLRTSVVSDALAAWKIEQETASEDAAAAPDMPEAVHHALSRVWTAAWAEAETAAFGPTRDAREAAERAERRAEELEQALDASEQDLEQAQDRANDAENLAAEERSRAAESAARAAALTDEVRQLRQQVADLQGALISLAEPDTPENGKNP